MGGECEQGAIDEGEKRAREEKRALAGADEPNEVLLPVDARRNVLAHAENVALLGELRVDEHLDQVPGDCALQRNVDALHRDARQRLRHDRVPDLLVVGRHDVAKEAPAAKSADLDLERAARAVVRLEHVAVSIPANWKVGEGAGR